MSRLVSLTCLLLGLLTGCRAVQTEATNFPSMVSLAQACGDVFIPIEPNNLRDCGTLEIRLNFPRPIDLKTVHNVKLLNVLTGLLVPLTLLPNRPTDRQIVFYADKWSSTFKYSSEYLLSVEGLKDTSGTPLAGGRLILKAEKPPYRFVWLTNRLNAGPDIYLTDTYLEATLLNASAEPIPAGHVSFEIVCDQLRAGERQTVYFANKTAFFAAHESKVVRLDLNREYAFQPAPWPDGTFSGCRNPSVQGVGSRRATFVRP